MATVSAAIYTDVQMKAIDIRVYCFLDDTYPAPGLPAMPPVTQDVVQLISDAIHAQTTPVRNAIARLTVRGYIVPA